MNSKFEQTATSIPSKVEKGDIISSINQSAETITIDAGKINLNGYVTYSDLSNGTTIDGGCIKIGQISAGRIKTGTLSGVTIVALQDITISTGSNASKIAVGIRGITFYIASGNQYIGLSAEFRNGTYLFIGATSDAYLKMPDYVQFSNIDCTGIVARKGNITNLGVNALTVGSLNGSTPLAYSNFGNHARGTLYTNSSTSSSYSCYITSDGYFNCNNTGASLGSPNNHWSTTYLLQSPDTSSDRNEKHSIEALDDNYKQFLLKISLVSYIYNNTRMNRTYTGLIAQEVTSTMMN